MSSSKNMRRSFVSYNPAKSVARRIVRSFVRRYPAQASTLANFIEANLGARPIKASPRIKPATMPNLGELPTHISHADLLHSLHEQGAISERDIHKWLTTLFADRRLAEFNDILQRAADGLEHLWLYHSARLSHYRGMAFGDNEALANLIDRTKSLKYLHGAARNLAVQEFCLSSNVELIRRAIVNSDERATGLTRVSIMGAVRLLLNNGHREDAAGLLSEYLQKADHELRLYFIEPLHALRDLVTVDFHIPDNWREATAIFKMAFTPPNAVGRDEFRDLYVGPLDRIPTMTDYMDIRIDETQRLSLQERIRDSVIQKKPLSLIRLGDGEAYAFTAPNMQSAAPQEFERDNEVRELHWWGENPPQNLREQIKAESNEAIGKADILGVPSIYRLIRDRGRPGSSIGEDRSKRGLVTVLNGMWTQLPNTDRIFTEERCHQIIFLPEFLEELTQIAARTVVVGCWTKEQINSPFLSNATFIQIPAHTKVRENADEKPLFAVYKSINRKVADASSPGTLVLIGAGLIGKIFIETAKSNGAVALDVGSMVDYMAGRKTRSVADMV